MARGDSAVVALRKAQNKLKEVQRNLAEAESDNPATGDLLADCVALKERVIARYESLGGVWTAAGQETAPPRAVEAPRVAQR